MNNIYVDELPKSCNECACCCKDDLGYWCQGYREGFVYIAPEIIIEKRLKSCPLKPLSDRLAEERKKIIDNIKAEIAENFDYDDLIFFLNKIERGEI